MPEHEHKKALKRVLAAREALVELGLLPPNPAADRIYGSFSIHELKIMADEFEAAAAPTTEES